MERVITARSEASFAVALPVLQREKRIEQGDIVVIWEPGLASALDTTAIADGRNVGNVEVFPIVDGKKQRSSNDVSFTFVVNAFEPKPTAWSP